MQVLIGEAGGDLGCQLAAVCRGGEGMGEGGDVGVCGDAGQVVGRVGRDDHPAGYEGVVAGETYLEASALSCADREDASGQNFDPMGAEVLSAGLVGRSRDFHPWVVVLGVVVDDDHLTALASELQRRGQCRGRATDHRHVAVALECGHAVVVVVGTAEGLVDTSGVVFQAA
ncbi:hypothetical protein GCM10027055_26210 [Janibacter alkaliphilus]